MVVVRTSSGLQTAKLTHFSIFPTSLTFDLEGVEYITVNLVYLYYFVADSDTHIECWSTDIFSADNPMSMCDILSSKKYANVFIALCLLSSSNKWNILIIILYRTLQMENPSTSKKGFQTD